MILPVSLTEWTYDTILQLIRAEEYELGDYDFKYTLNARGNDADSLNPSILKTACAMANTGGGFIIFGVKDRQAVTPAEDRIIGIARDADHRKQLGDKLQGIQQPVQFETVPALLCSSPTAATGVFVAKIPRSQLRPHQVKKTGVFYRRGDGGQAIPMDFWEVQEQMIYQEERQRKMRLYRFKLHQVERLADTLAAIDPEFSFERLETDSIELLLADICTLLPADDALLYDLTDIPLQAREINEALDRLRGSVSPARVRYAQAGNPDLSLRQVVNTRAFVLRERCKDCERRLGALFGAPPL